MPKSQAEKAKDMSKRVRALEQRMTKKWKVKRVRYGRDFKERGGGYGV